jgi:hypothetical protein
MHNYHKETKQKYYFFISETKKWLIMVRGVVIGIPSILHPNSLQDFD